MTWFAGRYGNVETNAVGLVAARHVVVEKADGPRYPIQIHAPKLKMTARQWQQKSGGVVQAACFQSSKFAHRQARFSSPPTSLTKRVDLHWQKTANK